MYIKIVIYPFMSLAPDYSRILGRRTSGVTTLRRGGVVHSVDLVVSTVGGPPFRYYLVSPPSPTRSQHWRFCWRRPVGHHRGLGRKHFNGSLVLVDLDLFVSDLPYLDYTLRLSRLTRIPHLTSSMTLRVGVGTMD